MQIPLIQKNIPLVDPANFNSLFNLITHPVSLVKNWAAEICRAIWSRPILEVVLPPIWLYSGRIRDLERDMSRKVIRNWGKPGLLVLIVLLFTGLVPASGVVAADEEAVIEQTVVTGSRIKRTGKARTTLIVVRLLEVCAT